MTFDYDIEDEDGEVVATVEVEVDFSPYVPAVLDRLPEDCSPAEGGEIEDLRVYENGKDITGVVDEKYGRGTYEKLAQKAYDRFENRKDR